MFGFLLLNCVSCLYNLDINLWWDILFANILSHLVDRLSFYSWLFLLWKSVLVWCSPTSHPSEWLLSKKQGTSVGRNAEKTGLSCTVGGNLNWCTNSGKQYEVSSKIQNRTVIWSRNSTSRYLRKENKNIKNESGGNYVRQSLKEALNAGGDVNRESYHHSYFII